MKRTNIVIDEDHEISDEDLMEKDMEITHARSKREVVQMAQAIRRMSS